MCMVFAVSITAIIIAKLRLLTASTGLRTSFDSTVPITIGNIIASIDSVEAFTSDCSSPCTDKDLLREAFVALQQLAEPSSFGNAEGPSCIASGNSNSLTAASLNQHGNLLQKPQFIETFDRHQSEQ